MLLLPSRSEGFGLVGLEGIAAGIPVLVSTRSGIGEFLSDVPDAANAVVRVSGDLETDAAAWFNALDFVLRDRVTAFARAKRLREHLEQRLSWPDEIKRLLALPFLNSELD